MTKRILLVSIIFLGVIHFAYAQDTQELIGQLGELVKSDASGGGGLLSNFSPAALLGSILFGSIGFIAFIYGKKNSMFRPMLIGIVLMIYPYFFQGTVLMYLIGAGLTAALYFFRE